MVLTKSEIKAEIRRRPIMRDTCKYKEQVKISDSTDPQNSTLTPAHQTLSSLSAAEVKIAHHNPKGKDCPEHKIQMSIDCRPEFSKRQPSLVVDRTIKAKLQESSTSAKRSLATKPDTPAITVPMHKYHVDMLPENCRFNNIRHTYPGYE